MLDRFTKLLSLPGATTPPSVAPDPLDQNAATPQVVLPGNGDDAPGQDAVDRVLLDRLFALDRLGNVSLRALPRGEDRDGDTLIAILFGFARLRNETSVTADRLMKSARQSGLAADMRMSRVLARQQHFVTRSGAKKSTRYGLNNPGMRRAEEILKSILG
jgi:hypothetical protein